jgi:hypothetical protein
LKKRMAARGRTIDPAKVVDVASWADAYKFKYTNIVLGSNGEFLVLDPSLVATDPERARNNPAKTIGHMRGVDYIDVLRDPDVSPELRASAHARLESNRTEIAVRVDDARATYLTTERELLDAVDAWKAAPNEAVRTETAMRVGVLSRNLESADAAMRHAAYPHRFIKTHVFLARKDVDYTSRDDRMIKHALQTLVNEATDPASRSVATAEGTA